MTERAREAEGTARLRCPFCHDAIAPGDPERVECAGCGAAHHAGCVVESGECAATGCGSHRVLLGGREVGLDELAVLDAIDRGDAGVARLGRLGLLLLAYFALVFVVTTLIREDGVRAAVLALGVVVAGAVYGLFFGPRRRNVRDPRSERQLFEEIGVLIPDPMSPLLDQVRRAPTVTPPLAGVRPTSCPACRAALGDAEDDDAWFCHHCGASLLPEASKGD